jgi:RimJ/RimL family protein N-acetyltransferase
MNISYRTARIDDAQAVLNYLDQVGKESDNLSFGEEGIGYTLEEEMAAIEKSLNSQTDAMILALDQDRIVSIGSLHGNKRMRTQHFATLGISVLESHWNLGIGNAMMKRLMDFAQQSTILELVRLDVRTDNKVAIKLYEKFGFEKYGQFKEEMKIDNAYISIDLMRCVLDK